MDANATKAPSTMGSIFDIKRLRSKPALPQQSLPAGQGSSDYNRDTLVSDDQRSLAIVPKEQQGPTSALTTRLPGPDLMLQTSEAMIPSSSAKIQHSSAFLAPLHAGSQAGPSEVPDYNRVQQQASSQDRQIKANDNHFADSVARSPRSYIYSHESSTVGHQWHVDNSSSSIPTQSRHTAVRSRFDSSTRIDDSNLSQQYPTSGSSLIAASPQTPRKVRNSSLPMGISPSASSSPIEGRQSPSSRRPLRPIAPTISSTTSSPYDHSLPLLPNQPSLPPSPRSKASPDGEMYESILPTSSSLRPNCQALPEGIPTTSPPSDSSERVASSERARPSMHGSSARSDMERSAANASSPPSHRKLVRKQSKGHMRRDSGTSGHNKASSSNSTVHSRSLSLPRSGSRGSTPTGSGSGSEQDDTTVAMSSDHSHFLTHRPAWLDQDPNATFPPPHQPNMPSRAKPAQHYPSLYQHHNNRSLTSLSQPPPDLDQDQAFFAPSSLPSTSAFPTQMEAAASPKRKASFYRRKRSQTATAVQGSQVTDSNGFPMPSPLSEIVKNMPLHDRMSHDVLHAPASFPKRSTSAGGFLFSITRKLSHPNLKDQHPNTEASVIPADTIPDYFGGTPAAAKPAQSGSHSLNIDSGPKLGSSFAPRSWRHPFRHNDLSKNEAKALPQLPVGSSALPGDKTIGDPFLASSAMSLSGFLHRSPRKDSLSSDKSEQSSEYVQTCWAACRTD